MGNPLPWVAEADMVVVAVGCVDAVAMGSCEGTMLILADANGTCALAIGGLVPTLTEAMGVETAAVAMGSCDEGTAFILTDAIGTSGVLAVIVEGIAVCLWLYPSGTPQSKPDTMGATGGA
mmetsp:Transcript_32282/g.86431  ORF Transcript_32282/g.86431 Transcript_32282/m.86431 type:complete len:121 (-) Transcript_32282:862-1224(-)